MDILVKNEPMFEDEYFLQESTKCCFICKDGQSVFEKILEHFKENHFEGKQS